MRKTAYHAAVVLVGIALFTAGCASTCARSQSAGTVVNDISAINPIEVMRVVHPRDAAEVQRLVRVHRGPISVGGSRHSMGGQIATEQALMLDMREMNDVLAFSPEQRTITVEAGITWRQIQDLIDPHDLSIAIMQSYANFTVGGSLSVNAHGRYVNRGPLVGSVRSLELVLADGSLLHADRSTNSDLFYGVIGGYGGLGVIVSATLELESNSKLERSVELIPVGEYADYFQNKVRSAPDAVIHNADFYPPDYDKLFAITYSTTDAGLTETERLQPVEAGSWLKRLGYFWNSELPFGKTLRGRVVEPRRLSKPRVVWRNFEASYDTSEIEPYSRRHGTYILQEYFLPVAQFDAFVPAMAEIFERHDVNVINVSVRHAVADPDTLLTWAPGEVFAFVIYYKQGVSEQDQAEVGVWTRELIDAALALGGTYYLPYQLHAADEQFHRGYPRAKELFARKARFDPDYRFRNKLWDRYFPAPVDTEREAERLRIHERLVARDGYARPENQSYLTLPEWYIVYSADEFAAHNRDRLPSSFPYFASIGQFWRLRSRSADAAERHGGGNFQYNFMNAVIGTSYTVEHAFKGLYENTFGRATEAISLGGSADRRGANDLRMAEFADDYAKFIHHTPWYSYPFGERLREFWGEAPEDEPLSLRRGERKFAGSAELAAKAAWASVIGWGTGTTTAPQAEVVHAWLRTPDEGPLESATGIRELERLGPHDLLVEIPRYERFKHSIVELAATRARFVEIAGNRAIMVTVIAPATWDRAELWGEVVAEWPILTDPERKRVALSVAVAELLDVVRELGRDEIALDHVYDY